LVPLDNPYAVKAGGALRLRTLVDGRAVANQLVVAGGHMIAVTGDSVNYESKWATLTFVSGKSVPISLNLPHLAFRPLSETP
jgi:hypothetical protein